GEFGQIYLLDWGIAAGVDRAQCERLGVLHVEDGRGVIGTPAYMAPEQALGDVEKQGPATDVYMLGACLHEVLTNSPPHTGADVAAVMRHAQASPPPELGAGVPDELAAICRRALARDPWDRYGSAAALHEAIDAFLEHREAHAIAQKAHAALAR